MTLYEEFEKRVKSEVLKSNGGETLQAFKVLCDVIEDKLGKLDEIILLIKGIRGE